MHNEANRPSGPKARGKSSTLEILGASIRGGTIPRKWSEYHRLLTQLRERFFGKRDSRTENAKVEVQTSVEHIADGATDSYDRDWALAMISNDQNALYEIDHALKRIDDGSYGVCELTGKPIEAERLKAIPWTRYCAEAQVEVEAGGKMSRPHLGDRGPWLTPDEPGNAKEEDVDEPAPAGRAG